MAACRVTIVRDMKSLVDSSLVSPAVTLSARARALWDLMPASLCVRLRGGQISPDLCGGGLSADAFLLRAYRLAWLLALAFSAER